MKSNSIPKVSVVLSVFNGGANYLSDTVNSILSQSYRNYEFIIVDDGSTDNSRNILADFCSVDSRIRVLRNEKNVGLVGSLNRAIDCASSRLIARIDCGDIADNKRIEIQCKFLMENPDYVLVSSQANWISLQGDNLFTTKYPCGDDEIRKRLFVKDCILVHPAVMFRKIEGLYYREMASFAEDYDYWLRLSLRGKFYIINEPLVTVRLDPDGTTYAKKIHQIKTVDLIHDSFLQTLDNSDDEHELTAVKLNIAEEYQERFFHFFTKIAMHCYRKSKLAFIFFKLISGMLSPNYMLTLIQMRLAYFTVSTSPMFKKYLFISQGQKPEAHMRTENTIEELGAHHG